MGRYCRFEVMARDYLDWSKEDLIREVANLRKRKNYGLIWEDQPEAVAERCETELPVLHQVKDLEIAMDSSKPINYLIEGDNYHSLSVLNYTHKGRVDVIYIDPPYNTGSQSWRYNNKYIDKEDSYRHSKWLSFMDKRLRLARDLLTSDGVIVVTIDDYEVANLNLLMDKIFGEENKLGVVTIMHNPGGRSDDKHLATAHEYALFYALDKQNCKTWMVELSEEELAEKYTLKDDFSLYELTQLIRTGSNATPDKRPHLYYPIFWNKKTNEIQVEKQEGKDWIEILPIRTNEMKRVWRWGKKTLMERATTEIVAKETKEGAKLFIKARIAKGVRPKTVWMDPKYSAATHGTMLLQKMLGERDVFNYPKSIYAVRDTLQICCGGKKDAVILDFFAGSGTTGHAVALLNEKDGGNRQFILCTNNENGIAREVCYSRIKAVTQKNKQLPDITGINLNLKYLTTDFVSAESTDAGKYELSQNATEMLCLRENTSKDVVSDLYYKIFKNHNKYIGIIFEDSAIDAFKKEAKKIKNKIIVYRFSLTDDYFDERFDDLENMVSLLTISEGILQTYLKIFRKQNKG